VEHDVAKQFISLFSQKFALLTCEESKVDGKTGEHVYRKDEAYYPEVYRLDVRTQHCPILIVSQTEELVHLADGTTTNLGRGSR
jgi:hypothetical protein